MCFIDRIEDGKAYVLQADQHGVTNDKELWTVGEYEIVHLPVSLEPTRVLYFARQQLGSHYGWFTIATLALDIITPRWFPAFCPVNKTRPTWICSALSAESLRFAGWFHQWPDPMMVTPAQLYEAVYTEK